MGVGLGIGSEGSSEDLLVDWVWGVGEGEKPGRTVSG